jgi:serine protease Do
MCLGVLHTPATAQLTPSESARRTPVVEVFERSRDCVVNISATRIIERTMRLSPFEEFFDLPGFPNRTRKFKSTSIGSGFIIHRDGYVVTNAHVVGQAADQKVIFADGTEYEAKRVAVDEQHDLAILKIQSDRTFAAAPLGRSHDVMIGETVIAIGNPLGYQHTVTTGIVSALNRELATRKDVEYKDLIQTDTSINRGNSGGPLLNVLGEVIGINTAIRADAQNIGFAIPIDSLRKMLPEMLSIEQNRRLKTGLRLDWRDSPLVVESRGPAAAAGIEPGDVLLRIDGETVHQNIDYFIHMLQFDGPTTVTLELLRGEERRTARLELQRIPIPDGGRLLRDKFGLSVEVLTEEEAEQLNLKGGLLITGVERGSPADRAGIHRGQVLVQIKRHFPTDLEEVGLLLEHVRRGEEVYVRIYEFRRRMINELAGNLVAR